MIVRCLKFTLKTGILAGLLILLGWGVRSLAQEVMLTPRDLDKQYETYLGPRILGPGLTKVRWTVFPNREGAPVYEDPECTQIKAGERLMFLEGKLYVQEASRDRKALLLVRSDSPLLSKPFIINSTVGWVKVENLLISLEAVRNPKTCIPHKAFVVNPWSYFGKAGNYDQFKGKMVQVRSAPRDDAPVLRTLSGTEMFFYVYDYDDPNPETRKWFLIGNSHCFRPDRIADCIIGWVPRDRTAEWDSRQAFEPDPHRLTKGNIYRTESDILTAEELPAAQQDSMAILIDRMIRTPWNAADWRYILLSDQIKVNPRTNTQYAKIGFCGPLIVWDPVPGRIIDYFPEGREPVTRLYDLLSNVNIIFVTDATLNMGPYLKMTADVATSVMQSIDPGHLKIRFGAVVYRDLRDDPAQRFDQIPLTDDVSAVANFLHGQRDFSAPHDDYPEALNAGVQLALEDVADTASTNILFVIGDAGNADQKDVPSAQATLDNIRDLSMEKHPYMLALHLLRTPKSKAEKRAIEKFEPDIGRLFGLIRETQTLTISKFSEVMPEASSLEFLKLISCQVQQSDVSVAAGELSQCLSHVLTLHSKAADMLRNNPGSVLVSGTTRSTAHRANKSVFDSTVHDSTTAYIIRTSALKTIARELDLKEEHITSALTRDHVQVFEPGWVPVYDSNARRVMKEVVLLSREELGNMLKALDELLSYPIAEPQLVGNFWMREAAAFLGIDPADVSGYAVNEYINWRYGIAFNNLSFFLSKSYEEIIRGTPQELRQFRDAAELARRKLNEIRNSEVWFSNYDDEFAWIPADMMP